MNRTHRRFALLCSFLLLAGIAAAAPTALERGDRAFARRAEGFAETGRPNAEAVVFARAAFEEAIQADADDVEARLRLTEALYFRDYFLLEGKKPRKKAFDRLAEFTEETVRLVESRVELPESWSDLEPAERASYLSGQPQAAEAHFWAAISWGLWGMSHAKAASGFKGVAGRIRDHGEMVRALDEKHRDAGGLRLLGRLHAATPNVILFTGWIDPELGIDLLEQANAISTADARNPFFLAEALLEHDPDRRDEALALLRSTAAREPAPEELVEQSEILDQVRERLRLETQGER